MDICVLTASLTAFSLSSRMTCWISFSSSVPIPTNMRTYTKWIFGVFISHMLGYASCDMIHVCNPRGGGGGSGILLTGRGEYDQIFRPPKSLIRLKLNPKSPSHLSVTKYTRVLQTPLGISHLHSALLLFFHYRPLKNDGQFYIIIRSHHSVYVREI